MPVSSSQAEQIRDARLRARISEALSQATNSLPQGLRLNLLPLLQQGRVYLGSVSSAELRRGLGQFAAFCEMDLNPAELLPLLAAQEQLMKPAQRLMAAPFLRPLKKMLESGNTAELVHWRDELKAIVMDVLHEDGLPPLVVA